MVVVLFSAPNYVVKLSHGSRLHASHGREREREKECTCLSARATSHLSLFLELVEAEAAQTSVYVSVLMPPTLRLPINEIGITKA